MTTRVRRKARGFQNDHEFARSLVTNNCQDEYLSLIYYLRHPELDDLPGVCELSVHGLYFDVGDAESDKLCATPHWDNPLLYAQVPVAIVASTPEELYTLCAQAVNDYVDAADFSAFEDKEENE